MPVHPQVKSFLDMLAGFGGPPLEQLPLAEARTVPLGMIQFGAPEESMAQVQNRSVPGAAGSIAVRVYRPVAGDALPALIFFHGGGFVICNLDTHDRLCRSIAHASGYVVISVDYRLAPEHKYPAAVEDAYAATQYVAGHPAEFGVDPSRIAIGGDSAGGNLAAVASMWARDRGGPSLKFQLLIYPLVDFDDQSPSMQQFGQGEYFLTIEGMDWFKESYLPSADSARDPSASPINATDFHGLPPALVITAECDPLRDQGEAYARKLEAAGVHVELKRYDGMIHPFLSLAGIVDTGRTAISDAAAAIRGALL